MPARIFRTIIGVALSVYLIINFLLMLSGIHDAQWKDEIVLKRIEYIFPGYAAGLWLGKYPDETYNEKLGIEEARAEWQKEYVRTLERQLSEYHSIVDVCLSCMRKK